MKTNANDPINAVHEPTRVMQNGMDDMSSCVLAGGLTKREYFAAMAMGGLLSGGDWSGFPFPGSQGNSEILSEASVKYADALIKALNEKGEGE